MAAAVAPSRDLAVILEALAVRCEERAAVFDTVAARWDADNRDQALGDAGIAAGYRGAADFAREALAALTATPESA